MALLQRKNLAYGATDGWRPPLFRRPITSWERWGSAVRRFFDLQAGSIWRDLAGQLPALRGKVLDVGCGAQPYRDLLSSNATYFGIDTVDAKARFGYEMPDTIYYSGNTWPVTDQSCDAVVCTEVLEHVVDPSAFVGEMHRCLRPGGRLLLTVPFAARWHFVPYDYWRFTPSGLSILLERSRFAKVEIYARGNALTVACYKLMALMLPLLLPQGGRPLWTWSARILGVAALPLFAAVALIGNLSLRLSGGEDCLGYTVMAERAVVGEGLQRS
jgi:SAM-dependent methyltransferase